MVPDIMGDSGNPIVLLYVDDETVLLNVTKKYLEHTGDFIIHTASSAKEALSLIDETDYGAVVSDYQMPEMDGLEFLRILRAGGSVIPFIIFTGRGREEVAIEALNAGANYYLQKGGKPNVQFGELKNCIRQAVEKNRAEKRILEYERRMADIINFLPDATFAIDTKGKVIAWNKAIEEMTGTPASGMLGKGDYEYALPFYGSRRPLLTDLVLHENLQKEVTYPVLNCENKEKLYAEVFSPYLRDGDGAYLWFTASPLYDTEGNVAGSIESIRDITERKKVEEALRENEKKFRKIYNSTKDVIILTEYGLEEGPGKFIEVNDAACSNLGYTREELLSMSTRDIVGPETIRKSAHVAEQFHTKGDATFEAKVIRKDGTVASFETHATIFKFNNRLVHLSVGRDITERKIAEQALNVSEKKFREIFNSSSDITFLNEFSPGKGPGRFIEINEATCSGLGYTREELLGMSLDEILTPETIDKYGDIADQIRTKGRATFEGEGIRKDGTIITLDNCSSLFELNNRLVHLSVGRDITERKKSEQALSESEKKFREIFNSTSDIIFLSEFTQEAGPGRFIEVNDASCRSLGYTREEMLQMSIKDIETPETSDQIADITRQFCMNGRATFEAGGIRKDGTAVLLETSATCFTLNDRLVHLSVGRDITDRKNAENALKILNKKLTLLSSITMHDISNQISVIMGYEEMLEGETDKKKAGDYLAQIAVAADIIQGQIAFTREYRELGLHSPKWQSVKDTANSVMLYLPDTGITIRIDTGTLEIFADQMLEKVLYNLFENAVRHGEHVTEICVSFHEQEGNGVVIIGDNGQGIADDMKESIFKRGVGSNTGFGLFLTRVILEITGITIFETGTEGKGARFEITVPKYGYRY